MPLHEGNACKLLILVTVALEDGSTQIPSEPLTMHRVRECTWSDWQPPWTSRLSSIPLFARAHPALTQFELKSYYDRTAQKLAKFC